MRDAELITREAANTYRHKGTRITVSIDTGHDLRAQRGSRQIRFATEMGGQDGQRLLLIIFPDAPRWWPDDAPATSAEIAAIRSTIEYMFSDRDVQPKFVDTHGLDISR